MKKGVLLVFKVAEVLSHVTVLVELLTPDLHLRVCLEMLDGKP